MKLKKINREYYLIAIEKPKVGDWVVEYQKGDTTGEVHFINGEYTLATDIQKKIIASTVELKGLSKLSTLSLIELWKEPKSLQDIIDKRNTPERYNSSNQRYNYSENDIKEIIDEYKESEKKEFTLDNMRLAVFKGYDLSIDHMVVKPNDIDKIIASIKKEQTEWEVKIEMEGWSEGDNLNEIPKITNGYINITKIN